MTNDDDHHRNHPKFQTKKIMDARSNNATQVKVSYSLTFERYINKSMYFKCIVTQKVV